MFKQSNLLRSDHKKGSLGKLPGSGCMQGWCAHAQSGVYLFFTAAYLFAVAERLRVGAGRGGAGGSPWVKEAEETHR